MTDKQIIIDGVDIKDCKRRIGKDNFCRYYKRPCAENNYNCIWKKYLRKEQECEELKKEIDDLKEIIQRHDNDNNALLSEFEDDLVDYYRRYKECLTEIKEIAEENFYFLDCYYRFILEKILQKISEVLKYE